MAAATKKALGSVVVIGGCGFLGHHIVDMLVESYNCSVAVIDLRTNTYRRPDSDGVKYFDGDICNVDQLVSIFKEVKANVVIHTASPAAVGGNKEVFKKVNIGGTESVVEACQKTNVTALVYTSSASVVSDNQSDLINVDEQWPIAVGPKEYYSLTKAEAEKIVLASNRANGSSLLTCSIRPAGIIGEGDFQTTPPMLSVYRTNKTGFQLGNNDNLFDFTYVANVAHGHCLAALALLATAKSTTIPLDTERVDGEAFFITNDSPIYFWDLPRMIWKVAGSPHGTEHVWVIPKDFGLFLGYTVESLMWLVGKKPSLTVEAVRFSCMTRYYNISKAKQRLGYKPIVSLQDGVTRTVQWLLAHEEKEAAKKTQ